MKSWENLTSIAYTFTNNTVENDFFGFPKVKWLQYTGKVGKCTSYRCRIFSGFNTVYVNQSVYMLIMCTWVQRTMNSISISSVFNLPNEQIYHIWRIWDSSLGLDTRFSQYIDWPWIPAAPTVPPGYAYELIRPERLHHLNWPTHGALKTVLCCWAKIIIITIKR